MSDSFTNFSTLNNKMSIDDKIDKKHSSNTSMNIFLLEKEKAISIYIYNKYI